MRLSALSTMTGPTQRLRRLAAHVLLAWLFALTTGIANACILQAERHDSAPAMVHSAHGTALGVEQSQAQDAHDHESHSGNPPCERYCDGPSAVTQSAKQQGDTPSGFWVASIAALPFTAESRSEADGGLDSSQVRWGATIPIPIAFLRLTL